MSSVCRDRRHEERLHAPGERELAADRGLGVNASSGIGDGSLASRRAVSPVWVNATSALRAEVVADLARRRGRSRRRWWSAAVAQRRLGARASPPRRRTMIRAIVRTVSTGYSPTLVSPDSITASAPSSTALATSEASARVGPRVR